MAEAELNYLFARLNIVSFQHDLFETHDKPSLFTAGFNHSQAVEFMGYQWAFFSFEIISTDNGDFIAGYLTKYRPRDTTLIVDEVAHVVTKQESTNVKAQSRFFVHIKSGLMVYHPVVPEISPAVFRNRLLDLFHLGVKKLADVKISTIDDRAHVLKEFANFERIEKIAIELVPSNPDNSPIWKDLDDDMKKQELAKLKKEIYVRPDSTGRALQSNKDIIASLTMAEDGYGSATVTGVKNGKRAVLRTHDTPVFMKVWEGEEEANESVLARLLPGVLSIFERIRS
jgi:hypothetical protein